MKEISRRVQAINKIKFCNLWGQSCKFRYVQTHIEHVLTIETKNKNEGCQNAMLLNCTFANIILWSEIFLSSCKFHNVALCSCV